MECESDRADPAPTEVLEAQRPQKRSCGTADKVGKHEHGVVPAACIVTQRLYPRHVGNLPALIAEIQNDYSNNQSPDMKAKKAEEKIGQRGKEHADANCKTRTFPVGRLADQRRGECACDTGKPEQASFPAPML